ncbi:MAG: TonB-dependent receptor, partial [Acidobacteria bacterium]|nr:TonB-dependent receptor [Acidobacteriota bacterium]
MLHRNSFRAGLCGLIILWFTTGASAQLNASLQGTVRDTRGDPVPAAKIKVINQSTQEEKADVTNERGFYRVLKLRPDTYTVQAEKVGFKKMKIEDIVIKAEDAQPRDFTLEPGLMNFTVTVKAEPSLQSEEASIRGTITTRQARRLPQVGRNVLELAFLASGAVGYRGRSGPGNRAEFIPGVEPIVGGPNTGVVQSETQLQMSVNGGRVTSNNYTIDGTSANSANLGGATVVTPNQESVKEMVVITSNYSARYGRNTGAQVEIISQNGTNEFHSSALSNYGSPKLNAFNKFYGTPSAPRPPQRVELLERKFAGSLGGPIVKNRLFFFSSYEGLRRSNTTFADLFVETPEFRNYVRRERPGSFAARLFSVVGIEPRIVARGLQPLVAPNGKPINGQSGLSFDVGSLNRPLGQKIGATQTPDDIPDVTFARLAFPEKTKGNQYNTRVDYNRGNDQFFVSTYFTQLENLAASRSGRPFQDILFRPFNSAATLTYIRTFSPRLLNEARLNFTRLHDDEVKSLGRANLAIPELNTNGFNMTGGRDLGIPGFGGLVFGIDSGLPKVLTQNTYEIRDTLSIKRGSKNLTVGLEVRREQDNSNRRIHARPRFFFDNLLSLANDAPFFEDTADIDPATGGTPDSQRYFCTNEYAIFAQNDWKLRPNLTLNLGLRWEYQSPFTEKQGRLFNFVFGPNGLVDGKVISVERLYDPDRNNFAPRLGFAWQPKFRFLGRRFSDERTVIRGGFGISYDRLFGNLFNNARFNPPLSAGGVSLCCGTAIDPDHPGQIVYGFASPNAPLSFPANPALRGGIDPMTGGLLDPSGPQNLPGGFIRRDIPVEINGAPKKMLNSYVYNYSIEIQQKVFSKVVASLGYQGSAGHKLIRTLDLNRITPGDTFDFVKDKVQTKDANGNPVTPRLTGNPNFERILFPLPDVNSNYNALILRVTREFDRGLQFEGIYRLSKSIDTSSFGRGVQQDFPSIPQLNRGPSDFDVRHNFTLSWLWDLPLSRVFRGRSDFVSKAFEGFQINGTLTAHSGFPWTPVVFGPDNGDPNGDGILPDRPTQFFGGEIKNPSNQDFIKGIFGHSGPAVFGVFSDCNAHPQRCNNSMVRGLPGIGRNSFRGPQFRVIDLSIVKQTRLPKFLHLREEANLEIRGNFFNAFNLLNLPAFQP